MASPKSSETVYAISPEVGHRYSRRPSKVNQVVYWLSSITFIVLSLLFSPSLLDFIWLCLDDAYHAFFENPLRDLYRYGPYLVGWEGASLPEICSRITYYGDRDFWTRNVEECELIFAKKEEAFLRISRPAAYTTLVLAFYWVLRWIFSKRAEPVQRKPTHDMIETYRAIQTLSRQLSRGEGNQH